MSNYITQLISHVKTVIMNATATGVVCIISKSGQLILNCEGLLIITAMLGIYLVISGNKELGNKFTSLSILIFILGKVLSYVG